MNILIAALTQSIVVSFDAIIGHVQAD